MFLLKKQLKEIMTIMATHKLKLITRLDQIDGILN